MDDVALVTGGLGFIGEHVVRGLVRRGDAVRVLDVVRPEAPLAGVEYLTGSVIDRDAVRAAMQGVARVFHLAGKAALWTYPKTDYEAINHLGTRTVVEEAERAGVARFVHTSSETVLQPMRRPGRAGAATEEPALDEMAGPYVRAKMLAEQEIRGAVARGLPAVIVSPAVPVGPGDRNLTPPARMLLGYLNGELPAYVDSVLHLVDVRDVADAELQADERGRVGERYVVGSEHLRLSELLALLEEITRLPMPRRRIPYWLAWGASAVSELVADHLTHRPPIAPFTGVRLASSTVRHDSAAAREELGVRFRPIRESLADAVSWFRERGLLRRVPGG